MDRLLRLFRRLVVILFCLPMNVFADNLDGYLWRNRLLFVVAPEASDIVVEQVRDSLETQTYEIVDRDVLVFQLFISGQSLIGDRPIAASQAQLLRTRLGVEPDEQVLLLIGKDGGLKRRAPLVTDLQEIFRQIDIMPMRRDEIREWDQSGR